MKADVLLITATFDSGQTPFTKLDNIRERTEKHTEGLLAWLADPHFGRVVLARNCATPVDAAVLAGLGREQGKEIEFLDCPASEMFYEEHLLFSHRRVQDFCDYYLEDAFFDDLRHAPLRLIERAPVLMGPPEHRTSRRKIIPPS